MFPEVVETDRLRLERLCRERVDVLEYYEVVGDAEALEDVVRWMPWDVHDHPKETLDYLARKEREWDDGEKPTWVIRPREGEDGTETADAAEDTPETADAAEDTPETADAAEDGAGELAGQTALHPNWDRRSTAFGVWLRPRFWGRGYSGERAAAALMHVAFEVLDLEVVAVSHVPDNDRSRRAIERYVDRFGGRREGTLRNWVPFDDGPRDAVRYSIHRGEYEASKPHDVEVTVRE